MMTAMPMSPFRALALYSAALVALLALSAWPAGISDRVIQNSPGYPAFKELKP